MDFFSLLLISVGLAMDAFAVSTSNGVVIRQYKLRYSFLFGLYFGGFQFVMPVVGYFAGRTFSGSIQALDHWIAFGLLLLIGGKMIWETLGHADSSAEAANLRGILSVPNMATLALATSIDALAVGITIAFTDTNIFFAAGIIGVIAFIFSGAGVFIGCRIGGLFQKGAERLGGAILIAIGVKILAEHLMAG